MKKRLRDLTILIVGICLGLTLSVLAYSYLAQEVGYSPTDTEWNVDNTKDAIDDLRDVANTCDFGCDYLNGEAVLNEGYTGVEIPFRPHCAGTYRLEVWGASGGNDNDSVSSGYGGYSTGAIVLTKDDYLYINVGGQGSMASSSTNAVSVAEGGYNGGGRAVIKYNNSGMTRFGGSGGGATSIALVSGLLSTLSSYKGAYNSSLGVYESEKIIIVAGGGGGNSGYYEGSSLVRNSEGGSGGGYIGNSSSFGTTGGTQTQGGHSRYGDTQGVGTFGQGGNASSDQANMIGGSGGGGFFGGGAVDGVESSPGGGGSGYIGSSSLIQNNENLMVNKMFCYSCAESSNLKTYTTSTTGTTEHTFDRNSACSSGYSSSPISECAKLGNGHVKITFIAP